jgi:protein disulfide-isomerase
MFKLGHCILIAGALSCFGTTFVTVRADEGELWQTDFAAAKEKAKSENKLILVDFTGSDWCPWCIKLHTEVFDKDEFKTAAPKQFVLVELDFPRKKKLAPALKSQNDKLAKQYKVTGYPTVLVIDPEGQVVAHTGYVEGGPERYVKQLAGYVVSYGEIVKLKQELDNTAGIDRAKLLDKLIDAYLRLGGESDQLTEWSKEIVRLDLANKTGLRPKHEFRGWMGIFDKRMADHKILEAKNALDKALAVNGIGSDQKHSAQVKLDHIKPLVEALETVAQTKDQLEGVEGLDRAKLLDKYLEAQTKLLLLAPDEQAMRSYLSEGTKLAKEIVKLDGKNEAGLKTKYSFSLKLMEASTQAQAGAFLKARALVEQAAKLPGLTDEQKATIDKLRSQLPNANVKTTSKGKPKQHPATAEN